MSFTAPIPLVLKIPYVHALFRNVVHVSEIFCTCDRCCDVSSKKQHEVIPAARDCRDRRGPHTGALWSGGNLDPPTSATVSTPGSHHMVFFAKKKHGQVLPSPPGPADRDADGAEQPGIRKSGDRAAAAAEQLGRYFQNQLDCSCQRSMNKT